MSALPCSSADAAEWAALFAAGALAPEETDDLAVWRAQGWPEFEAELRSFGRAVEAIGAFAVPVPPPPRVRGDLLSLVALPDEPADQELHIQRDGPEVWRPTPFPGIAVRVLSDDRGLKRTTICVRMQPGSSYPPHPHEAMEECLVLEGELLVGDVLLRAGDYQRAEPGSRHAEQTTKTGALLLLTLPLGALRVLARG